MYAENYEALKKFLRKGNKFTFKRRNDMIPFTSNSDQRLTFENGTMSIVGAFSRLICNKKVKGMNVENISENIFDNDLFEVDDSDEYYANLLVNEYLGGDQLNILHPKLFLYLPLSEGPSASVEIKIAQFFKNVFFREINIEEFFTGSNSKFNSNILIDFIVDNLKELPNEENSSDFTMPNLLNNVVSVFKEDLCFLLEYHEDFLVKNFDKIIAFYLYFYINQFTLKAYSNSVSEDIEKTFFLLDWETVSKNRQSVKFGYRRVLNYLKTLLVKVDCVEHVNFLIGKNNMLPSELIQYYSTLSSTDKKEFIFYFKTWISYFCEELGLNNKNTGENFEELLQSYFELIYEYFEKGDSSSLSRYYISIENLGKKYFLKRRGRYGYMFNINQEMLILITSLCIKQEKIKITQLFYEYERRGLFFDRDSSDKIVELFNKLNLIDKKSDSGDIQYVKSIL